MKVAIYGGCKEQNAIRELLVPWNVHVTTLGEAELVIAYKQIPSEAKKTIFIPSCHKDFTRALAGAKLKTTKGFSARTRETVFVYAGPKTVLSLNPSELFVPEERLGKLKEHFSPTVKSGTDLTLLTFDIVGEYGRILRDTLDAKPSLFYRVVTNLPVPYDVAPRSIRDWFMREPREQGDFMICDKLSLDALRFILAKAIEGLSNEKLDIRNWKGKKYAFLMTHDVETLEGLETARKLKRIELRYDLPSAWYIPSKRYTLNKKAVQELANHGEVGTHDTKHDGKLDQIDSYELTERLKQAKKTLESLTKEKVDGFRAPLLQHSTRIIRALRKAGYTYDTSIPTWEPKHPRTMRAHGISTIYPITLEGIAEIPITLPQDHQLLHISGLSAKQTVRQWMRTIETIKDIGGLATFLVHPEYALAQSENATMYEDLLNLITSDPAGLSCLPVDIADSLVDDFRISAN